MRSEGDYAERLRETVVEAAARLRSMSDEAAGRRPADDKWSPKEIVGHLIDSATNNHRRFVMAQLADPMRYEGYDQDDWVRVQQYRRADWMGLIDLWEALNLHLVRLMSVASPETLKKPRNAHNMHRIAWELVPEDAPVTLDYFMRDYGGHLRHHLRQIDPELATRPERQRGSPS